MSFLSVEQEDVKDPVFKSSRTHSAPQAPVPSRQATAGASNSVALSLPQPRLPPMAASRASRKRSAEK